MMKKFFFLTLFLLSISAFGQKEKYKITEEDYGNEQVEMADLMRQNGKIYVVVGVIMIIFAGITFYVYRLDTKITALEKDESGS